MEKKRNGTVTILTLLTILTVGMTMLLPTEASAASRPAKVKSLKVARQSYNSLKVSWKKVKSAKGYQIYRATKKSGKYKKVKTIKKAKTVSWTNKKLTTGKRYYYKVRAIRGSRKGSFSAKKSGVPTLSKTSGVRASATSSSAIKVSWKKTAGAKGYQIYRATSKSGSYSKVKTTSTENFTNTGLAANKTYYYKVRSYCKVGKATKYSNYSSVVYAKTKAKAAVIIPTKPTKPAEPTTPIEPTEPSIPIDEEHFVKMVDPETNQEITELQAGKVYDFYSSNFYSSSIDGKDTSDSRNQAAAYWNFEPQKMQNGVLRAKVTPVVAGSIYVINDDGVKKQYRIVKGTTIHTGGLNLELGGPVPAGYTESYDTIYGYTQYVYNKDKENLVLVGAEDGVVKTIFTMDGIYSMNTDEEYLKTDETSFGAVTIQPIRYYEYNTPTETILSGSKLDHLGKEANLIASALRVKNGYAAMTESIALASATRDNVVKVYDYYGNSQKLDDNVHMISSLETYENALTPEGCSINAENAVWGSYGAVSAAVSAVEALYDSPGHRAWMFNEKSEQVRTAFMYDGSNYICALQAYAYKR